MKSISKTLKPRNPFVAASLLRSAGAHTRSRSAHRQHAQRALRLELDRSKPSP